MKYGLLLVVVVAVAMSAAMVVGCKSEESKGEAKVAQKSCPVMPGDIDKSISVDYEGKRVYFCCEECEGTFEKDPEKYLKKLAEMGEEPIAVPEGEI